MSRRSAIYSGTLIHARRDNHAHRTFEYPLYMASLDLDELGALDRELRLFSHGRRNVFSLDDRDYESGSLDLGALRAANGLPVPATTRLVTNLCVLGYVFNPVSFFLDYDAGGALVSVIAEINNTYGGRRRYVMGPAQRLAGTRGEAVGFAHVRELFVSPFLHGDATYELWLDAPLDGDRLAITMHVDMAGDPDQRVFVARFAARRRPLRDRTLAAVALRYPLMTLQVIGLIHYEAFKLRWQGLPYRRPGADHRPIGSPTSIVSRAHRSTSIE